MPLRPVELASASVLAGLAVVLTVAGWFLPHLGVIAAFAVVPLGIVAYQHRLRALLASTFAASVLAFLVAGTGTLGNTVLCAAVGGLAGTARRRGRGPLVVAAGVVVIGPALGALSVGLLAVFASLRKLSLDQVRNTWKGVRRIIGPVLSQFGLLHEADSVVAAMIRDWWIGVASVVVAAAVWYAVLAWVFIGAVVPRIGTARDRLESGEADGLPGPVPVSLRDVGYRYPNSLGDALTGVDLDVVPGEMIALVGDNGSGKSTLARILAGRPATSGSVRRPGGTGLGKLGGTAVIMQNPDSQVLGVRVADDVVWGMADHSGVDVPALLQTVGLAGMEDRETSGLSGGELQRLAVAAALARRPQLLISDESTAMIDSAGRESLTRLLRHLPDEGTAVVHVTHRAEEAAVADRSVRLDGGRVVDGPAASPPGRPPPTGRPPESLPRRLVVAGVSHTYGIGSPWAQTALRDVDLSVDPGEGVLVVGGNGSGKSTLAWIMAGLTRPTHGECLLGGQPVREQVGSVALAFQHARLQLQRRTVSADVKAAGAPDDAAVAVALASVGLDPAAFADRRIDELSGGQQRRVALAGLLARRPSVLVLDEPMAGLDSPSREALIDLLVHLRRHGGLTVVVISHDYGGMDRLCDRTVTLTHGRLAAGVPG